VTKRVRRSKRPKKQKNPLWIISSVVVLVVGLVAGYIYLGEQETINQKTLCLESGPEAVTVILVDTSDPLNASQKAAYNSFFKSFLDPRSSYYLAENNMLVIYELGNSSTDEESLKPNFKSCSPGNPKQRSTQKKLTQGEALSYLRWDKFQKKISSLLLKHQSMLDQTTEQSPIVETLKFIRHAEFLPRSQLRTINTSNNKIIIISDMLQNTPELTHYVKSLPKPTDMAAYALELENIKIEIKYLSSKKYEKYQGEYHVYWWRQFFSLVRSPLGGFEVW